MGTESDRVMFEIYREDGYDRLYRVVYFTELSERNRDLEIGRAMAGEHLVDGFIRIKSLEQAKKRIEAILDRLNAGERIPEQELVDSVSRF